EYYWANYATGLGASLHELGHTFDLAHTPSGIMARGFDDLHKVFTVQRRRKGRHHHRSDRQRQRYNSGGSSNSEVSRTPSTSSIDDTSPSLGSSYDSANGAMSAISAALKRQTDICYGSPNKQALTPSDRIYTPPAPLVVSIESGFRQIAAPTTMTFSVKNYDGSETRQTIVEGETIRSTVVREGSSTKMTGDRRPSSVSLTSVGSSSSLSPTSPGPSTLPNSPEDPPSTSDLTITSEVNFVDAGAHWYRSSAVVLRFHKWFNKCDPSDCRKNPTLQGARIKSPVGIRIVELRTDPEGSVFHHWEFLNQAPPTEFVLHRSKVSNLPADVPTITILAEDSFGNILKKRFKVEDFA
ncbi:uncharacterized protein LOC131931460, partial [Physella acuta]|uniref:uncharacterized protein LOC131931460 n=1 Tax=Physella acuta TaxID=109671 RepID=UPI0027DC5696